MGYEIDDRVAEDVSRVASSQAAFRYGKTIVVSTLSATQQADLEREAERFLAAGLGPQDVRLGGEKFLSTSVELAPGGAGPERRKANGCAKHGRSQCSSYQSNAKPPTPKTIFGSHEAKYGFMRPVLAKAAPAAVVSGHYWHHLRQEQPASEALDPQFQEQLIAKLEELTGVALPQA